MQIDAIQHMFSFQSCIIFARTCAVGGQMNSPFLCKSNKLWKFALAYVQIRVRSKSQQITASRIKLAQVHASWCKFMQAGASSCKLVQVHKSWCKIMHILVVQVCASWCKLMQAGVSACSCKLVQNHASWTGASSCKLVQVHASWCKFIKVGARSCIY